MDSDRIFAVQITIPNSLSLSIIGVYLPTTECPVDTYKEYLQELENVVHALQTDGPVLIMGDFSAHISNLHYACGNCESKLHGDLLMNVMTCTDHCAVSLCELTSGPYFYFSGGRRTTVDFCLLDNWAAHLVSDCVVMSQHPLNLSDHLALAVEVNCKPHPLMPLESINAQA